MKHEFTNNDLGRALDQVTYDAGKIQGVPYVTLRQFLDALPDVPHCGDCAVDRAKAGVYEQLLDHPYFDGWSEADASVADYMIVRLNEAHKTEQEPADDWQECRFEDIQKGDRVKRADAIYAGDTVITAEGTVARLETNYALAQGGTTLGKPSDDGDELVKLYRIPAPVQYPNPLDHPAIVVIETREDTFTGPSVFVWTGGRYENEDFTFDEDDITKWHPIDVTKVVADDE